MARDPERWRPVAGEYVLGTLPDRGRERFSAMVEEDAFYCTLVGEWEERLHGLAELLPPEPPPPGVWTAIEKRIGGIPAAPVAPATGAAAGPWRSLRFWRGLALAALAVAVLAVGLLLAG